MGLVQHLGRFVAGLSMETLPAEVIEKARTCLLYGYGIGLACRNTPYTTVADAAALAFAGGGKATILASGHKTSVAGAALANSALFHGRGQEDTCGAAHFGAILVPLLTAMIEANGYPLDRLIPALVAGYEVGGPLERAMSGEATSRGLRSTALFGAVAAAAAAGRMKGLSAPGIAAAIANAASFSGGTLQSIADGTDECRYQVGVAGVLGLLAAELAEAGSVTSPHALEGRAGVAMAYAGLALDVRAIVENLGREWSIGRVTFKPYPVCAFNQTPVIAALELREQLVGKSLSSIQIRMCPYEADYAGMDSRGPFRTITDTLMSAAFCVALTIVRGEPSLGGLTCFDDRAVLELVRRTTLVSDEKLERLSCMIDAVDEDGQTYAVRKNMTNTDFDLTRREASQLIRRIGISEGVRESSYNLIEDFAEKPHILQCPI